MVMSEWLARTIRLQSTGAAGPPADVDRGDGGVLGPAADGPEAAPPEIELARTVLRGVADAPPAPGPGGTASRAASHDGLCFTTEDLDVLFCGGRGLDFLGVSELDRSSLNIGAAATVSIIQRPRGRPREVAVRGNQGIKADG